MADQPGPVTAAPAGSGRADGAGPLSLAALRGATLERTPWAHAVIPDAFTDPGDLSMLLATYPTDGFKQIHQDTPDSPLIEVRNSMTLPGVDASHPWGRLLAQLASAQYREALQDLTGLDLDGAPFKPAFYRYPPTFRLSPHRDHDSKLISHVLYFNRIWPQGAGGRLLINYTSQATDIHTTVSPVAGTSVVIVRSDDSWHCIEPVSGEHTMPRRSLVLHVHKPGSDVSFYDH